MPINIHEVLAGIEAPWQPEVVDTVNDYDVRVAKIEGAFHWHVHEHTDEVFLGVSGEWELQIKYETGVESFPMGPGDLHVVPRGVEHRPVARQEAEILMFEPSGTVNRGD